MSKRKGFPLATEITDLETARKIRLLNLEDETLVMFPSSKNFPKEEELLDDPLADLLNEFSDCEDMDEDLDEELREEECLNELNEALVAKDALRSNQNIMSLLNEQLKTLKETTGRLKFYLDEIENAVEDLSCHK
jgi:hypothetical protein